MLPIFKFLSVRAVAVAMALVLAAIGNCTAVYAQTAQIYIVLVKSGKIFSSYGSGSLYFNSRRQRLRIAGLNIDALPLPRVRLDGAVSNLNEGFEIAGTYHAAPGGYSFASSTTIARLENQYGVVLELHSIELDQGITIDLAGMTIAR